MSTIETFPATGASEGYWLVKRGIDLFVGALLLVALSPLLLLIACAIKLYSPGPVLFVQERVGYDRVSRRTRLFKLYKFRSMRVDADQAAHREVYAQVDTGRPTAGRL